MLFGIPLTNCGSKNTFGCTNPGFTNSSNDNTRPTTDCVFPFGGGDGDTCVVDVVGESVLVCVCWVSVLVVGVASEFGAIFGVGAVAGEDWIVGADVVELRFIGLAGFTGETGLVGLLTLFTHVFAVVVHEFMAAGEYGLGHVNKRVWIMLPV